MRIRQVVHLGIIIGILCFTTGCVSKMIEEIALKEMKLRHADPDRSIKLQLEKLKTGNEQERIEAAGNLDYARPEMLPRVVPALIQALRDPDPRIRKAATLSLAGLGKKASAAAPALETALEDSNGGVAYNAAVALREMEYPEDKIRPTLEKMVTDRRGMVRVMAAEAASMAF